MVTLLLGNKSDLEESRQVEISEIDDLISRYNLHYIEVSAKTGDHIKLAFESLTKLIIEKNEELMATNKINKNDMSRFSLNSVSINKKVKNDNNKDKRTCCSN